jgi:hypothetical protein
MVFSDLITATSIPRLVISGSHHWTNDIGVIFSALYCLFPKAFSLFTSFSEQKMLYYCKFCISLIRSLTVYQIRILLINCIFNLLHRLYSLCHLLYLCEIYAENSRKYKQIYDKFRS